MNSATTKLPALTADEIAVNAYEAAEALAWQVTADAAYLVWCDIQDTDGEAY